MDTSSSSVWTGVVSVLRCHGVCILPCVETGWNRGSKETFDLLWATACGQLVLASDFLLEEEAWTSTDCELE